MGEVVVIVIIDATGLLSKPGQVTVPKHAAYAARIDDINRDLIPLRLLGQSTDQSWRSPPGRVGPERIPDEYDPSLAAETRHIAHGLPQGRRLVGRIGAVHLIQVALCARVAEIVQRL